MANYVTITGANCFKDIDGTPLCYGKITITASDAVGMPVEFSVAGEGLFTKRSVWRPIDNGSLSGNALKLANPTLTSPSKVGFTFLVEARKREDFPWETIAIYPAVDITSVSGIFDLSTLSAGNYLTAYPVSYVQGPVGPAGPAGGNITLTTTGTSGPSTLIANVLNVPKYASGGGSGTVTSVTSADGNATVANTTTTPVVTIVSAPKLATARNINGVAFDGTAAVTVPAAAGTLTGTALAASVTTSSLTTAAGGTFGTAAFTASTAYDAAGAAAAATSTAAQKASNLSDLANAGTARTNLGLGTAATQATSAFDASGAAAAAQSAAIAACQAPITLTTTGTSGAATFVSNTLNIPTPSAGSPAFSAITGATNTTAAMVVGSGASLAVSGSGAIGATTLLGNTWAAPGAIGGTTPAASTFTTTTTRQIIGSGSAPTYAAGVGMGTSPTTPAIVGTDCNGTLSFTTGTSPTAAGIIATITFATTGRAPNSVVLFPGNSNAGLVSVAKVFTSTFTTSGWVITCSAGATLTASSAYVYSYAVFW